MNGEMLQLCSIAAACKKAIKDNSPLSYTPIGYENKVEFAFLPTKFLFITKAYIADSVDAWFSYCLKKGLNDVMFLAPVSVQDRFVLGFSNTTQGVLACFYKKRISYFTAQWDFDISTKMWNVLYVEQEWKDPPALPISFEDNTDSFIAVTEKIKDLAVRIGCDDYAAIFEKTLTILNGSDNTTSSMPIPPIPAKSMRLFRAACSADVFGGMGSWNDSPSGMALEKGRGEEYDLLSTELLKQIRIALLYAINAW